MDKKETTQLSKYLSYVLRHRPDEIGIELDDAGWISVDELLEAMRGDGKDVTIAMLQHVVSTNSKRRFAFNEDQSQIRANQGHSIKVELGYEPSEPPELLYHGTVEHFIALIRAEGIKKGKRHDVHLSPSLETAADVGSRRGKPIILVVRARELHNDGHKLYLTPNGVWLTDCVPVKYIEFPENY